MKKITGVKIRTNNARSEEIMQLWASFFNDSHLQKLGLESQEIYAVYHNYASDETGDYDLLVGGEIESLPGYETVEIQDTKYKQYNIHGEMPASIIKVWKDIWDDKSLNRAFETDYELYTPDDKSKNPTAQIFIGLK